MTWHVSNIRDANWFDEGPFGVSGNFQRDEHFDEFGLNFAVVWPGQPVAMYHREANQEGFLVLAGECLAIVEGEEHPMRQWEYLRLPGGHRSHHHRRRRRSRVPDRRRRQDRRGRDRVPGRSGGARAQGGRRRETTKPPEAYAPFPDAAPTPFSEDYLPAVSPPTARRSWR